MRNPRLWFVVPAAGRFALTDICLRQLRWTCDQLTERGIDATAVVVACDENLDTARALGFGTIDRDNRFLSRRFNDGIQLAADGAINPRPADYVVPCGSDDWVHPDLFAELPDPYTVHGFQHMSFVREDGREIIARFLNYRGGAGIRVYPRTLLQRLGFRPAAEDLRRACDTSILGNVTEAVPRCRVHHVVTDPRWIVDWKSPGEQLNAYWSLVAHRAGDTGDPFDVLGGVFPAASLAAMRNHYERAADVTRLPVGV